jgi:hypothetical protein
MVLLNALANTGWPFSGGAHYSIVLVPFLVAAAAVGLARLSRGAAAIGSWGRVGQGSPMGEHPKPQPSNLLLLPVSSSRFPHVLSPATLLVVLALVVALRFQMDQGVAPFSRRWSWSPPDRRDRLGASILQMVPPHVPVSAQSGLYPHLSHRQGIYQFPTIADADIIALDVTNHPAPLDYAGYYQQVQLALANPQFGLLAATDGFLLLQRGGPNRFSPGEGFLTFTLAGPEEIGQSLQADFGDALRLEGYTLTVLPVVDQRGPHVQITTFWRALRASPGNLRPVLVYASADGPGVDQQTQLPFELYWHPTEAWQVGPLYRLTWPEPQGVDYGVEAHLAVVPIDGDPQDANVRLKIRPVPGGATPELGDSGTLVRLLELSK